MLKIDGYEVETADKEILTISLRIAPEINDYVYRLMHERDSLVGDEILFQIYNKTLEDLGIPTGTGIDEVFLIT